MGVNDCQSCIEHHWTDPSTGARYEWTMVLWDKWHRIAKGEVEAVCGKRHPLYENETRTR